MDIINIYIMKYPYKKIVYVEAVAYYCSERGVKYPYNNLYKATLHQLLEFLNKFKDFNIDEYVKKEKERDIRIKNNKKDWDYKYEIIKIKFITLQQLTDHIRFKNGGNCKGHLWYLATTEQYLKDYYEPRTTDEIYNIYTRRNNFIKRQHIKALMVLKAIKI